MHHSKKCIIFPQTCLYAANAPGEPQRTAFSPWMSGMCGNERSICWTKCGHTRCGSAEAASTQMRFRRIQVWACELSTVHAAHGVQLRTAFCPRLKNLDFAMILLALLLCALTTYQVTPFCSKSPRIIHCACALRASKRVSILSRDRPHARGSMIACLF